MQVTEDYFPCPGEPHASSTAPALELTADELVSTNLLAQVPAPGGGVLAAVAGTSPQRRSRASLSHEQPGEALSESCPAPRHLAGFSRFSSHCSTRLDLVFRFDIRAAAAGRRSAGAVACGGPLALPAPRRVLTASVTALSVPGLYQQQPRFPDSK